MGIDEVRDEMSDTVQRGKLRGLFHEEKLNARGVFYKRV